jgi:hypothetical protein
LWLDNPIRFHLMLGDHETALVMLEGAAAVATARQQLRAGIRIDPRMRPWADDGEIAAILAEPASATTTTATY